MPISDEHYPLARLRQALGLSQGAVAEALETSQDAVLKTERSQDPRLSTLRSYIGALGRALGRDATLHLTADVAGAHYPVQVETHDGAEAGRPSHTDVAAWKLRAWDDADLEHAFLHRSVIAVSADEIGDMTVVPTTDVLIERLHQAFPDRSLQAIGTFARYWRSFRSEMPPGHVVAVPLSGRRVAIGEITGDYDYRDASEEPASRLRHTRPVTWGGVARRGDLEEELRRVINSPGTLGRIHAADAARRLMALVA